MKKILSLMAITVALTTTNASAEEQKLTQRDLEGQKTAKIFAKRLSEIPNAPKGLIKKCQEAKTFNDYKHCKMAYKKFKRINKKKRINKHIQETAYKPNYEYKAAKKYGIDLYGKEGSK